VEDQQPDPGDLTEAAADEAAPDDAGTGPDDDAGAADAAPADAPAPDEAAGAPQGRRSGRWLAVTAGVCAALFVGASVFTGAAAQPYLADRALIATKLEIAETAVNAVNALWNYTPENMGTLTDRASVYLSGDLEHDYRKFIDAISETNRQAKVTDNTQVTGVAVESVDGPEATVLVYTNTSATSGLEKTIPSLKYQSHRLFMRRDHHRWVVTKMPSVTSLSLTPQL
jgi:Mce-associated membrane protein